MNDTLLQKARQIKLLLTDVDGVMTNGTLSWFTAPEGQPVEIKHFESLDGMGLLFLQHCGIKTGIISRGDSDTLKFWASALHMDYLFFNMRAKQKALAHILDTEKIQPEEIAFIGDDIIDLAVLKQVGLPLAVKNSVEEVKQVALYTAQNSGGAGAVREICELILKARGQWQQVVADVEAGVPLRAAQQITIVKDI